MAYKYFLSGISEYTKDAKDIWLDGFQALLNAEFENAPDLYTIQEETTFGSSVFSDIQVRINRGINVYTGQKLGDDFKMLLFKDINHATPLGSKYYFDSNYWIVVNLDVTKNFGASCMVRRCNNVLRWIDTSGNYWEEPCAISYEISFPRDKVSRDNMVLPGGDIDVYCQQNIRTNTIKDNQRFLFGNSNNRVAYKVFGAGVRNFLNASTYDDDSASLLMMRMGVNFVNYSTDNVDDGVADVYEDYNKFTSASVVGAYSIVSSPITNDILEGTSTIYNVQYYSGSVAQSGSFVFSVSGSAVPTANYTFTSMSGSSFSVTNNEKWLSNSLDILASGSSGSRIFGINLRGAW